MAGSVLSFSNAASRVNFNLLIKCFFRTAPRLRISENEPANKIEDVSISESCVARLKELGKSTVLRVGVDGGGCSGFQYKFELDTPIEEGDHVFTKDGVSVVIDETSLEYLKGSTIEYHTELIRSAFRIANNPIADKGCSCGASFNIKVPER